MTERFRGDVSVTLQRGYRLGPYEVISLLGAGGMGEVYRARDTRLGREVAIKVLPAEFASDRERLRRFEKEARSASALNHPNIVTIHDIGFSDSVSYIAMELVEGSSLGQALARGPLPIKKLLSIATQIADGLAQAHEAGIVHRDLKPENVMVGKDGQVKILDFGLAKTRVSPAIEGATSTPTETATDAGSVLGTVGYMSPEQISGIELDHRSDQFSLGAVLYEMVTGRRAFQKKTAVDTMSAILNEEPQPIIVISPQVPTPLRWIIERCLAKAPEERYASTRDLARDLATVRDRLSEVGSGGSSAPTPRRSRAGILTALAVAAASLVAAYLVGRRPGVDRTALPTFHQLTFRRGGVQTARFTWDGRTVVYGASWDGAPVRLFSTRSENPESAPVALSDADLAAVSSSAELLLFPGRPYRPGNSSVLSRAPLAGGTPRIVAEDVQAADWGLDARSVALARDIGGTTRIEYPAGKVLLEDTWARSPRVSRDGARLAYYTKTPLASVAVVDLAGNRKVLSTGWKWTGRYLAWSPKGDEVWFTATKGGWSAALHAVSLSGRERVLLRLPGWINLQDVSADGRVLLTYGKNRQGIRCRLPGWEGERDLSWFDSSNGQDLSADGKNLLFVELGESAPVTTAYLRKTDGSPPQRLGEGFPVLLSPDGKTVLALDPVQDQYLVLSTEAGEPRRLPKPASGIEDLHHGWFFPDSRRFLVVSKEKGHEPRSYAVDLDGGREPLTPEGYDCAELSPDGKSATCLTPKGRRIYSFERKEAREIPGLAEHGEQILTWSEDGKSLFIATNAADPTKIYRLELATGKRRLWLEVGPLESAGLVRQPLQILLTPDGGSYCYTVWHLPNDLYLVDGLR